jgi:tripartite-type tricarboxylate transporter receptor subunit TctC
MKHVSFARVLFCGLMALAQPVVAAEGVESFYAGRTLRMVVPSGPGGGYDLYARMLIRHYGRQIPGHPTFVLQHFPSGGIVPGNYLYGQAPRDGSVMGLLASSTFLLAALGDVHTKFENLKFTFIGNMNEEVDTCSVWRSSAVKNFEDLKTREVNIGSTSHGSNSYTFPIAMNAVLGTKFRAITGYPAAAQARTFAMERGELEGSCGIFVSTLSAQLSQPLAEGNLRVIVQMGLSRHPDFKDVPNALELAQDPDGRAALELLFAQLALGRPVLGPPDIPADRVAALQHAFDATMTDPQFMADAAKAGVELRWFGAQRMRQVMERMEAAPDNVKNDVSKLLTRR